MLIKQGALVLAGLLCVVGAVVVALHQSGNPEGAKEVTRDASPSGPASRSQEGLPAGSVRPRAPTPQELVFPPAPPPPGPTPPAGANQQQVAQTAPEPPRALIGITGEDLSQVEQRLPQGAQIVTYPAGMKFRKAALVTSDLNGDGIRETAVVYKMAHAPGGEPQLILGVLSPVGDQPSLQLSIPLVGSLLYDLDVNGDISPFSAHDLTGDKRPEVVVASGAGASSGGWLQIFSIDGPAYYKLAHFGGHHLKVRSRGRGKPPEVVTQWKGEDEKKVYGWTGKAFEQVRSEKTS